jgi:hypothetical protein
MNEWPPTASSLAAARGALSGAAAAAAAVGGGAGGKGGILPGLEMKVGGMMVKSEIGGVKMEGGGCLSMQQQQQRLVHGGAINQQLIHTHGHAQETASDSQSQA